MTLLEKFNSVDYHGRMNLINDKGEYILTRDISDTKGLDKYIPLIDILNKGLKLIF